MPDPIKHRSTQDIRSLADEATELLKLPRQKYAGPRDVAFIDAVERLAEGLRIAADRIQELEQGLIKVGIGKS